MYKVLKSLWPDLKPHKSSIIFFILIFGIIYSATKAVQPRLLELLQVNGWERRDQDMIYLIPILIFLIMILSNFFRYFHFFHMKYIADKVAINLRKKLMSQYLHLNLGFSQEFATGSAGMISRMMTDIHQIQVGLHMFADLVREPFGITFILFYLFYTNWKLTLILIVSLPLILTIMRNISKSLRRYGHENLEAMEDITKTLKESLDGARVVQSFNLQTEMENRFNHQTQNYLQSRKKIIGREEISGPVTEILSALSLSILLIYAGHLIYQGEFSMGQVMGYLLAIGLLADSSKKFQQAYVRLQTTASALARIHSLLDTKSTIQEPSSAKPFPENWQTIEFKNVSFSYGDHKVLKNINLTVKRGEMVALVGTSGGGKSTLVNLLERFMDPTEGVILIDGVPINEMALKDLRNHIALVTQDVFLFADSIEYNILSGNFNKAKEQVPQSAQLAHANEFIEQTPEKYQTQVGDLGSRLSGGQKQRISIARAIFKDAPILILDEATSALDSQSEKEVQKALDQLVKNRTVFTIAHRLSTIVNANRILVLDQGQIVEQGTHEELLNQKGIYWNLYK